LSSVRSDHSYAHTATPPSTAEILVKTTEKLTNIRKKLDIARKKNGRLHNAVADMENMLKDLRAKFNIPDHVMNMLKESGSDIPASLFHWMAKNVSSKTTSRGEYPAALRSFALTLHFYSPKAYR
jgi:hypothetical protein